MMYRQLLRSILSNELLDKVLVGLEEESKRYHRQSLHYSHIFGPLQIHREFKPMRDMVQLTAYAYVDGGKVRVDMYAPGSGLEHFENLDEFRRYSLWLVEQELLKGNYMTKEEYAEEMRLWREQHEQD